MKKFLIQFCLLQLPFAGSFLEGTSSDSTFLKVHSLSEPIQETTEGKCKFPVGEGDAGGDYEEGSFSDIAAPFYDLPFKKMFSGNKAKERLKGFLNAIYYPDNPKIVDVAFLSENQVVQGGDNSDKNNLSELRFDVACRCHLSAENRDEFFDLEMQNKVRGDHSGRFFGYGMVLKSQDYQIPARVIVLLNYKETKKQDFLNKKVSRFPQDGSTWYAVCSLSQKRNEKGEIQVDKSGKVEIVLNKVVEDILAMNEIDLRANTNKILNGEEIYIGSQKILSAGREWIKLLGVWHWAKEDENGRFRIPSEECIGDPQVKEAVRVLKDIDQTEYIAAKRRFEEQWNDLVHEREEGEIIGEKRGREKGRIEGEIKALIERFVYDENMNRALKAIRSRNAQIFREFVEQIWNEYADQEGEIPEGKTVEAFIDILRDEGILAPEQEEMMEEEESAPVRKLVRRIQKIKKENVETEVS